MIDIKFDKSILELENGLKIVTIKKDTELFSINLGVKIGAYYENNLNRGISHFIEHMMFKGTKNRDNETLNRELEFLGGEYNAYTNYDSTVFSISCLKEEVKEAVDLLSDMILNPTFNKEEMEREKGVVISEIRSSKDDVAEFSTNKVFYHAFEKSPLRYEVAGSEETVKNFTREEILEFYSKNYTPDNTIITVVSPFEHDFVVDILKGKFQNWQGKSCIDRTVIMEKNKAKVFTSTRKDIEQSNIIILYSFLDIDRNMELPLKILNHQLGESANSILFRELREKRGLVYDVYTDLDLSHNAKNLYIYTAVDDSKIDETLDAIFNCINNIKNEKIVFDNNTVELMKKVHKTAVVSTFEDGSDLGSYILTQCLEGEDIYQFLKDMERLEKLNAEDIYKVAREVINDPTIYVLRGSGEDE